MRSLDLGRGPIFPLLLKMSWPSIMAMLAVALANLIDAFWLARLSTEALAALAACFPIQMIFAAIGIGTGVGAGSYAARMFGANQSLKARQTAGHMIFLSILPGILTIVSVILAPEAILKFFGAHADILPLSRQYLSTIVWGTPFLYLLIIASNLLRAEGRPTCSMIVVFAFCFVLILIEPFLVFGWGPFPPLGISGAALAAVISYGFAGLLSLIFIWSGKSRYQISRHHLLPRLSICLAIYQTGFPTMIMNLVVSGVMIAYNHVLNGFGPLALATFGICFRLYGLVSMVLLGIGYGVMPLVAFNDGAGQHQRLSQIVRIAVRCSTLFSGVSSLLLMVFAEPIVMLFTGEKALVELTVRALQIFVMALILFGPIIVWINMFIGLGKGTTAMLLMLFRDGLLLIPLLFLLPRGLGIEGVWMAQPISTVAAFFLILVLSARQMRRLTRKTA
jgi:putative MATE family efflux protein